MALELDDKQRLRWKALKKRIQFSNKNRNKKYTPTIEHFIEKEKELEKNHKKTKEK